MRIQAVQDIIDFLRRHKKPRDICFHKKYTPVANTYKNLIFTQGFGYSGSSVIVDLLALYDNMVEFLT